MLTSLEISNDLGEWGKLTPQLAAFTAFPTSLALVTKINYFYLVFVCQLLE